MNEPNPFEGNTTTVLVPAGKAAETEAFIQRGLRLHEGEPTDRVIVLVPAGTGREARARIWKALGTAPEAPPAEPHFELEQAVAYEDNIRRMMEGT